MDRDSILFLYFLMAVVLIVQATVIYSCGVVRNKLPHSYTRDYLDAARDALILSFVISAGILVSFVFLMEKA